MPRITWIRVRTDLHEQPEVLRVAARLGVSAREAVGLLVQFWGWLRSASRFCCADVRAAYVDRMLGAPGFCAALVAVDWLEIGEYEDGEPYLAATHPEKWLTHGADNRALAAERMAKVRARATTSEHSAQPNSERKAQRGSERGSERKAHPETETEYIGDESPMTPLARSRKAAAEQAVPAPPSGDVVLVFPTAGKAPEWPLTAAKVVEYREAFPDLDVLAECRRALQWCRDKKTKRKTARGMPGFLLSWLSDAQDRGRGGKPGAAPPAAAAGDLTDRIRRAREGRNG